ncbi:hypothetical protein ACFY2M_19080 [Streptomyces sp. NPDC001276]|uniref:hypothetical protein n=1 Tax=Streptomyces sp. NPDC001276 TaxID=3364555 RepID=UPI0036A666FD
MPDPIPMPPRHDDSAADMGSLIRLGQAEPQPEPAPADQPAPQPEPIDPEPQEPA